MTSQVYDTDFLRWTEEQAAPLTRWQSCAMSSGVALYEALINAHDDRARARVTAEAFERLKERYPHLPELATQRTRWRHPIR